MALPEGARAGTRLSSAGLSPANVAHALVWLLHAGEMPPVEKKVVRPKKGKISVYHDSDHRARCQALLYPKLVGLRG